MGKLVQLDGMGYTVNAISCELSIIFYVAACVWPTYHTVNLYTKTELSLVLRPHAHKDWSARECGHFSNLHILEICTLKGSQRIRICSYLDK